MAPYAYDEGGNMAWYFVITFLFSVLVPVTLSARPSRAAQKPKIATAECECGPCIAQRKKISAQEGKSWRALRPSNKTLFIVIGWATLAALSVKMYYTKTESSVYDPHTILGINVGASEKEIKKHFKRLSLKFHPDKVKLAVNQTMEDVSNYFVDLTKAYKALTDPEIRKNLEEFGHPDGRQEMSMGIALPPWLVEAQNNGWVLGAYGALFGVGLPALVYNWWFGSRQKTKDGVYTATAAAFFTTSQETDDIPEVVQALGKAAEWSTPALSGDEAELAALDAQIGEKLGAGWTDLRAGVPAAEPGRARALTLLHAHLLRLPLQSAALQAQQAQILLRTPALLNAYLNIAAPRSWLAPMLAAMRLQAHLAQAVPPGGKRADQLPLEDGAEVALGDGDIAAVVKGLGESQGADVKKAAETWGRVAIVDAAFKVIGEKTVTPSALIHLVVKLRLVPPAAPTEDDEPARAMSPKEEEAFLSDLRDAEDAPAGATALAAAHAPRWPAARRPGWWIVLADARQGRAVIPPLKIGDVPFGRARAYKMKFNGPPGAGVFPWRVMVVSDTFIGEDVAVDVTLRVEEPVEGAADDEDDISDPEEDSLAGQMAAMRGGRVKPARGAADESEDESTTDDGGKAGGDSSSDSDSD